MFQRGLKISGDDSGHVNLSVPLIFHFVGFQAPTTRQRSSLNINRIHTAVLCPLGNGPCLGFRKPGQPYQWISYTEVFYIFVLWFSRHHGSRVICYSSLYVHAASAILQVAEQAQVLGSGLLAKGCEANPQQFVGIFAQNRPEVRTQPFSFVPILVASLRIR